MLIHVICVYILYILYLYTIYIYSIYYIIHIISIYYIYYTLIILLIVHLDHSRFIANITHARPDRAKRTRMQYNTSCLTWLWLWLRIHTDRRVLSSIGRMIVVRWSVRSTGWLRLMRWAIRVPQSGKVAVRSCRQRVRIARHHRVRVRAGLEGQLGSFRRQGLFLSSLKSATCRDIRSIHDSFARIHAGPRVSQRLQVTVHASYERTSVYFVTPLGAPCRWFHANKRLSLRSGFRFRFVVNGRRTRIARKFAGITRHHDRQR